MSVASTIMNADSFNTADNKFGSSDSENSHMLLIVIAVNSTNNVDSYNEDLENIRE
ncbi:hypothetical protein ACSAZL_15635 [Methanosarcina sp. T3]|uniref:hypothetical protein n=1 Tax=Methanosarcina sp. T3 TaxID=3439062 RepID=UPI003F86A088